MQTRLIRFIDERTRLLTAMSHDLKTPLTRMRLRAEMLEDASLREKFESDLLEMESMVTQTLEFMRGLSSARAGAARRRHGTSREPAGRQRSHGPHRHHRRTRRRGPGAGAAQLLKRCLVQPGRQRRRSTASEREIRVEDAPDQLTIRVRDHGPGIPEGEIEKVFEPFYRLEGSRSRETGGTGLGLSIARNIAQAHGGDVRLRNHEQGGLEAIVTLPWKHETRAPAGDVATAP